MGGERTKAGVELIVSCLSPVPQPLLRSYRRGVPHSSARGTGGWDGWRLWPCVDLSPITPSSVPQGFFFLFLTHSHTYIIAHNYTLTQGTDLTTTSKQRTRSPAAMTPALLTHPFLYPTFPSFHDNHCRAHNHGCCCSYSLSCTVVSLPPCICPIEILLLFTPFVRQTIVFTGVFSNQGRSYHSFLLL